MRDPRVTRVLLALILLVSGAAITLAMRRTSTTFDEIVLIAGGARGYETGNWNLAPEHPPFTQYMYGLLPYLSGPAYPGEATAAIDRYTYARAFFWGESNDPERLAFLGRLPAAASALLLVFLVFHFTRRHFGDAAGLLAAAITAFLPDVLAHGGVAYNDVPVAAAFFAAVWLLDDAVRRPSPARGAFAGLAVGLALGIKNSALTLGPIALLLLIAEATTRRDDRTWRQNVPAAATVAIVIAYLVLVAVYRGDFTLAEYRVALDFVSSQVTETGAPAYLLGRTSPDGWWYYFPVAFVYKTSLGFHILLALAVACFVRRIQQIRSSPYPLISPSPPWRRIAMSPLRTPSIAVLAFGMFLILSKLNIGFRYALPILPMLAGIAAPAAVRIWHANWRYARIAITAATAWLIIHPLSYYPNFLAYISEYGPGRDENYRVLVDSSLDWGQGLIQLRDFLREHDIPRVYLSYYGSAQPEGYGIDYIPLLTIFAGQAPRPSAAPPPEYVVISATNLAGGSHFAGTDPYHNFREQEPAHVIAHTMYIYRIEP